MESGLGAHGSFVALNNRVSQSVPHLHLHVVPRTKGDGLRGFFWPRTRYADDDRSEEHTSELQSRQYLVCRLLLEKKKKQCLLEYLSILHPYQLLLFTWTNKTLK